MKRVIVVYGRLTSRFQETMTIWAVLLFHYHHYPLPLRLNHLLRNLPNPGNNQETINFLEQILFNPLLARNDKRNERIEKSDAGVQRTYNINYIY